MVPGAQAQDCPALNLPGKTGSHGQGPRLLGVSSLSPLKRRVLSSVAAPALGVGGALSGALVLSCFLRSSLSFPTCVVIEVDLLVSRESFHPTSIPG